MRLLEIPPPHPHILPPSDAINETRVNNSTTAAAALIHHYAVDSQTRSKRALVNYSGNHLCAHMQPSFMKLTRRRARRVTRARARLLFSALSRSRAIYFDRWMIGGLSGCELNDQTRWLRQRVARGPRVVVPLRCEFLATARRKSRTVWYSAPHVIPVFNRAQIGCAWACDSWQETMTFVYRVLVK